MVNFEDESIKRIADVELGCDHLGGLGGLGVDGAAGMEIMRG